METVQQIEIALLGALLRDRFLIARVLNEGFRPELVRTKPGMTLATTILDMYGAKDAVIDEVTVRSWLSERSLLTPEVNQFYDEVLQAPPPGLEQVMAYVDLLKLRESRDRLARLHNVIGAYLRQEGEFKGRDMVDVTTEAIHTLLDIQRGRLRRKLVPLRETALALQDEISREATGGGQQIVGYSMAPFQCLNRVLSGLRPGFYYGLAGAPRRGKTNFALHIASAVAANHRIPALFYSWEQTTRVLAARLIGCGAQANPASFLALGHRGKATAGRFEAGLERAKPYLGSLFLMEGGRGETLDRIKAHAYNLMHDFSTDRIAIFFDYLQKIPLRRHFEDSKARIDEISSGLADLSLELNCPIFAISVLDKEGCRLDERPEKDLWGDALMYARPTMHHCTGSGDIEYDLDVALILAKDWRATEELYDIQLAKAKTYGMDPSKLPKIDLLNLYVDKNRDAPEGTALMVQYAFFIDWNKFVEVGFKGAEEFSGEFRLSAKIQRIYQDFQRTGLIKDPTLTGPAPGREPNVRAEALGRTGVGPSTPKQPASPHHGDSPRRGAMWATTPDDLAVE
jgi:replicative DNA helicase